MNRLRYVWLAALVQLAAACSGENVAGNAMENRTAAARPAPAQPATDGQLILAFGDSLYAGYGVEQSQSFPAALERALATRGVTAQVVNAGVSGDTTAGGLQRLGFTLDGLAQAPDLAIVGLGANDALRGLSPAETRRNLAAILTELRRRNIPVLLTGMMAPRNLGADYVAAFDPIYPALAREYDAALMPFFLDGVIARPELLLPDGMHPNPRGIEAIADRIAPQVAGALGR